jgi:glycosyltransferase involved in cell wall biosynthesis
VSIVLPAYNDARTISSMVYEADRVVRELTDDYEIIVVNDGSSDGTQDVLVNLAQQQPRLRLVQHARNRGYGGALRSGFRHAEKELIFYTDGDAQYDPSELKLLWARLSDGDLVQGYKIARHDPAYRIVIGVVYQYMIRIAFNLRIRDPDCDFRLIRRTVLEKIGLTRDSGAICVELVKKTDNAGFRIVEVPIQHHPRPHGSSQFFSFRHIATTLFDLAGLWRETVWRR